MTKFSKALRGVRATRGISVREAAAQAGVSAATFNRAENGKLPDVLTFRALIAWAAMDPTKALQDLDG